LGLVVQPTQQRGADALCGSALLVFHESGGRRCLFSEPRTFATAGDGGPTCGARRRGGRVAAQPRHIGGSASEPTHIVVSSLALRHGPPIPLIKFLGSCV
jgi:hypothetical protein